MTFPHNSDELRDPVCGMVVSPDSPHRLVHQGQEFAFCSPHCLLKFQQQPEQYVAATEGGEGKPTESESKTIEWEAEAPRESKEVSADYFTCPMHPEVKEPIPRCPKCGMFLQPPGKNEKRCKLRKTRELLQAVFTTPAPCTRKFVNPNPVPAPSAAWPWSRPAPRRRP